MDSKEYSQLELFQQERSQGQATRASNPFLKFIWQYEKVILVLIGVIVTGVISYCFGVEKGKRLVPIAVTPQATVRQEPLPLPPIRPRVTNTEKAITPVEQKDTTTQTIIAKAPQPKEAKSGNYTIQIATYQNKKTAQKEADSLKKQGFTPTLQVTKNGYSIICIGKFNSREKAKSVLTEIRKSYQDSYIRRL